MESDDYFSGLLLQVVMNEPAISSVILFVCVFILLLFSAFLSACEQTLFSLSPDERSELRTEKRIRVRWIRKWLDRPQQTLTTISVSRTAIHTVIIWGGIYGIRLLMFQAVGSVLYYVFAAAGFCFLFFMVDGILSKYIVKNILLRIKQSDVSIAKNADEQQDMLDDILHFYHKTADEIMIPRLDMTAIGVNCALKEVLDIVIKTGFSRIPIYEETEDHIQGILYVKDLLPAIRNPESFQWKNLIRPAYFVPENKKIDDLLEEFRTNKTHIAIVVDEFGCTSGLVTIEDVLEEIVGEITDEYDSDEKHFWRLPDGSYIFEGKIQLNDFFRETEMDAAEFGKITEEVDTLAGLLLKIKGTLPHRREVIDYKQYRFRILEADERRVLKVKYSLTEQTPVKQTRLTVATGIILLLSGVLSCTNAGSMPKPKGFYRIEIPEAQYRDFSLPDLPYSFNVSQLVTVELPLEGTAVDRLNLAYTTLNARIYCSYQNITLATLSMLEEECRELVSRNAGKAEAIAEQAYENQDIQVYGTLFRIEGETVSPFRFILTDSANHFFHGALYYECKPNVDSLAPVTKYLNDNVIELIQSFHWK